MEAGSEAGGQLTNDEWLEYLLNIKKQSGEVCVEVLAALCQFIDHLCIVCVCWCRGG